MNDAHPDHEKRGSDGETRRRSLRESISSPTVRKLLQIPGITPLSFVRSAAYALRYHFLSRVDLPDRSESMIDSHGHEFPSVDYLDFPLHVSGGV